MGFFSALKEAAENSHGEKLWAFLQDTLRQMGIQTDEVRDEALVRFVEKRSNLIAHLPQMTKEGRVKMGKFLQAEARKKYDTHLSEGYALWLAGAWLESIERPGVKAGMTHEALNTLADALGGSGYVE